MADAAEARDGFRVDAALNSGKSADRSQSIRLEPDPRSCCSSRASVAMMQPADLWNRDHRSFRWMLDSTWHRCITFQRKMRACFVIVREVVAPEEYVMS